ncbi:MAG TPA: HEAT repeat domain-containing protein [Gemmataceae bacterium]|nr:HEAT repeat domain-containing protein [Gemmataceae bacterium]
MVRRINLLCLLLAVLLCAGCRREKSTDELIADLKSPQAKDRIGAVRLLEQRRTEPSKVVPVLIEALKDTEDDVRWGAANGLGYYGEQARDAIPALQQMQQHDPDARVRLAAKRALTRIDPSLATPSAPNQHAK